MYLQQQFFDQIKLDESFGVGGHEDTAYCIEAKKLGFKIAQVPSSDPMEIVDGRYVSLFPVFHVAEGTMHDNPEWQKIFNENGTIIYQHDIWENRVITEHNLIKTAPHISEAVKNIINRFKPTIITEASSIASGLSCACLIFKAGKFKIDDSSDIVPLSERTALAFI